MYSMNTERKGWIMHYKFFTLDEFDQMIRELKKKYPEQVIQVLLENKQRIMYEVNLARENRLLNLIENTSMDLNDVQKPDYYTEVISKYVDRD